MIAQACKLLVTHQTELLPLTQKFNGLYAEDCSTVRLPNDLIDELPGCGGSGSDKKEPLSRPSVESNYCQETFPK